MNRTLKKHISHFLLGLIVLSSLVLLSYGITWFIRTFPAIATFFGGILILIILCWAVGCLLTRLYIEYENDKRTDY